MDIATMRARLRQDLHDEDASNYRWTDAELDRHIQHALREFSLARPLEAKATLFTSAGSRDLSLAGLASVVSIEAVEYPTGQYPPSYVRFSTWLDTLTILSENVPQGGEPVTIYYTQMHTIDATSSTLPAAFEDILAAGAAGYAALEWSSFSTNRVNAGGREVWRDYLTWAQERLAQFRRSLARHSRYNAVRARRLYTPATPPADQGTVTGP